MSTRLYRREVAIGRQPPDMAQELARKGSPTTEEVRDINTDERIGDGLVLTTKLQASMTLHPALLDFDGERQGIAIGSGIAEL